MADETEENLDNPINTQSENFPDKIIPTIETETVASNQETENMEVHHHPDLHHKPKKWKEYFLEFIMIFLAVTMGFIAENIREHFADKETVKKNIEMMVNGLQNDTARLNQVIFNSNKRIQYLDTLLSFQGTNDINELSTYRFRELFFKCGQMSHFISNSSAFEQMKSSGSIKLIKKKEVLDSIYSYNQANTVLYANKEYLDRHQNAAIESSSKFMNYQKAFQTKNDTTSFAKDIEYYGNDKINIILEFFNDEAASRMVLDRYYIPQLQRQKTKAISLIVFLKNEYGLED